MNKMGQGDILDFLKENKTRWMTSKEIQNELQSGNQSSVTSNLKKLRKRELVKYKKRFQEKSPVKVYIYKHKE